MGCGLPSDREPRGFVLVSAARGAVVIFGALYAGVAINEYANSVAGCGGTILNDSVKVSSVLASLGVIEGVFNAILMPFIGTFADLTPYRKPALLASVVLFSLLVLVQSILFISKEGTKYDPKNPEDLLRVPIWQDDTAIIVLVFSVVLQVAAYEVTALLTTTYAPELSPDPMKIGSYVSQAYTLLNLQQLLSVVVLTGVAFALGMGSLQIGMVAGAFTLLCTVLWFVPGYPKLGNRRDIAEGVNKGCCGLSHLREIMKDITTNYWELFKFLCSWTLASASMQSITILSTSYLTFHLGYSGTTVSGILGGALLMSVPGSLMVKPLIMRFNIKWVYVTILVIYGLSFIAAPILMVSEPAVELGNSTLTQYGFCNTTDPDPDAIAAGKQMEAPGYVFYIVIFFVIIWGLGIGAIYALNTAYYAMLIPGGKESSFYGVKVTFAKLLTWAPPLAFSAINEKTDLLQYAILVLAPFFLGSAAIAATIDVEKAMEDVKHTLHLRRRGDEESAKVQVGDKNYEVAVHQAGGVGGATDL